MGYTAKRMNIAEKKYAFIPKITTSKKTVWFNYYWTVQYRDLNTFELTYLVLNEKEYLLWQVIQPVHILPTAKPVYR